MVGQLRKCKIFVTKINRFRSLTKMAPFGIFDCSSSECVSKHTMCLRHMRWSSALANKLLRVLPCETGGFRRDGLVTGYFAGAQDIFPHVDRICTDKKPTYENLDVFFKQHGDEYKQIMQNKVKKCLACGKPCAFTLPTCNACGEKLGSEIQFTDNIFMCFIFGVGKGPFPYTISLRSESERFMVFDDLLALSPAHFNIIPTFSHIPDWRYLLKSPKQGLELLYQLYDEGRRVLESTFWNNADFKAKYWPAIEDMDSLIMAGFNYPPSQYQVHLQFICAPLAPFQYNQFFLANHFHHDRFFTFEYVEAVLKVAIKESMTYFDITESPVSEAKAVFDKLGVRYDDIHRQQWERYHAAQRKCAAWDPADFRNVVIGNVAYDMELKKTSDDPKKLQQEDKLTLQNYGRPYSKGKSAKSFFFTKMKTPK
eukprot:GEMP01029323.1.p1 GENE.GEMP01029323.1~~GEMP01029323.1.p1  ORF type:complete len:425 (+),score=66.45 GEMP01029323.1:64-1338(+)